MRGWCVVGWSDNLPSGREPLCLGPPAGLRQVDEDIGRGRGPSCSPGPPVSAGAPWRGRGRTGSGPLARIRRPAARATRSLRGRAVRAAQAPLGLHAVGAVPVYVVRARVLYPHRHYRCGPHTPYPTLGGTTPTLCPRLGAGDPRAVVVYCPNSRTFRYRGASIATPRTPPQRAVPSCH